MEWKELPLAEKELASLRTALCWCCLVFCFKRTWLKSTWLIQVLCYIFLMVRHMPTFPFLIWARFRMMRRQLEYRLVESNRMYDMLNAVVCGCRAGGLVHVLYVSCSRWMGWRSSFFLTGQDSGWILFTLLMVLSAL